MQTVPMWEYVVRRANDYGLALPSSSLEPIHPKQLDDTPHGIVDVGAHFRPLAKCQSSAMVRWIEKQAKRVCKTQALCDAVAYGKAWIANPDLVERFTHNAPLNPADPDTFTKAANAVISITRH